MKPVVTHAGKALGQDVDKPSTNELVGVEVKDAALAGLAGCPGEQDIALGVVADESLCGKRTTLDVAGEVTHRTLSAACGLEFDVPGSGF